MIDAYDGHSDCGGVHERCACGAVYYVREQLRCACMEQCVACGSGRGVHGSATRDVANGH
jgi:hypothetical protein